MRKSTKLKIFRRKKRSVILSVLKRHSLRQHTNANIRQLRKKQVLQHDVVLVQKQPVIETESYGAENIRDTKRFYPILGRDVHSGYESTCFLSEEDYKKREIGDTITMTRFIWK